MPSDSEWYTISKTGYGLARHPFFIFMVVVIFLASATPNPLFAQVTPQPKTQPRISLGVLIDTSAHQKKVIEFEREAVNSLADAFAGVATEGFVVRYGNELEILQDWSPLDTGLKKVSSRIELDAESGKNPRTRLNDAFNFALSKMALSELEGRDRANSKVLIVIGEGNDAGSVARYDQVKKWAKSAHVQCFVFLVADHNLMGGRVRHFGFYLYDLASATKGKAYDIERSRKNLDNAIRDVLKRVR